MGQSGYGSVTLNGKTHLAHRIVYEAFYGKIPADLEIDHLCRNRRCVNPGHMEAVTHAENVRRGPRTKLTPREVALIRTAPENNTKVARRFGMDNSTISRIRSRESWADFDEELYRCSCGEIHETAGPCPRDVDPDNRVPFNEEDYAEFEGGF